MPTDPGLMHRAGMAWAAQVSDGTRDAYWSVADRIVATMDLMMEPASGGAVRLAVPTADDRRPTTDDRPPASGQHAVPVRQSAVPGAQCSVPGAPGPAAS